MAFLLKRCIIYDNIDYINLNHRGENMGNHYVPRLVLRKYNKDEKICTFNVETGEYKENVPIESAFQEKNFYDSETERNLNRKIESQFGNLFSNKILKCGKKIELTNVELKIVKKFLLVSVLRAMNAQGFTSVEREMYYSPDHHLIELMPFTEKVIEGESDFDYWLRTINVILDTDGTPVEVAKHPDATYVAYRWAMVINAGQVAFWDSVHNADEYVITDIGMTSENEPGWDGVFIHNVKKQAFMADILETVKAQNDARLIVDTKRTMDFLIYFHENFMMFPISARRMIVTISPFFRVICNMRKGVIAAKHDLQKRGFCYVPKKEFILNYYTKMNRWKLFEPNDAKYVHGWEAATGPEQKRDPNDLYIYKPVRLTAEEVDYCNRLFIDRIGKHIGFSSLDNVYRSILSYKKHLPRNNYSELYKIIEERYKLR